MGNCRTPILTEHKPAYDDASSEAAWEAVVKMIKGRLKQFGKKGLPRKLGKVCHCMFPLLIPHNW
jgi:hypothetical protein